MSTRWLALQQLSLWGWLQDAYPEAREDVHRLCKACPLECEHHRRIVKEQTKNQSKAENQPVRLTLDDPILHARSIGYKSPS